MLNLLNRFKTLFKSSPVKASDNKIVFKSYGGQPYLFGPGVDAFGYLFNKQICAFEMMQIHENMLVINHFGVMDQEIGAGLGERSLREFASLIKKQNIGIDQIYFELYKASSNSDIVKLASSRQQLLERIGAEEVTLTRKRPDCIQITGIWLFKNW